jgi:hypothetical protein
MIPGGFPWRGFVWLIGFSGWFLNSVNESHPGTDQWQESGAMQPPPALLGHASSLNAMSNPLVLVPAPLVTRSRKRTVAKADSMTLVVRRCFQCSAGKSKKLTRRSQLAVSDSIRLGTSRPLGYSRSAMRLVHRAALWRPSDRRYRSPR